MERAVKEDKVPSQPQVIESRIVGRFTGYDGRSRFQLENGQVWAQSQQITRRYPPVDSPPVIIVKGKSNAERPSHVYPRRRQYPRPRRFVKAAAEWPRAAFYWCSAMLEPTQVLFLLNFTPIIAPWLMRTRLFTRIGSPPSGQTNIIRISAFERWPSTVGTKSA